MEFHLPLLLTFVRLVISPIVLPFLLVYLLPLDIYVINLTLAGIFLFFGLTDFFDGYLARRYGQETDLGRILDPIADKFLVYSTLIALLAAHKIFFVVPLFIIGRELFVMGLRLVALERGMSISVSFTGKLKTVVQMAYLACVIANPYNIYAVSYSRINQLELLLLLGTIGLTLWSAYTYYMTFTRLYKQT